MHSSEEPLRNTLGKDASSVEQEHVHEVYNKIAPHFSNTRYKPWPLVERFLKSLGEGTLIADVGCGNGKYLHVNPSCMPIGSDMSFELISICKQRGFECIVADNLQLPYRSDTFEAVISIAVIHHMATDERRLQAIRELARILQEGGTILITVWAFEQKNKNYTEQDVFIPWHLHSAFDKDAGAGPQQQRESRRTRRTRKKKEEKKNKQQGSDEQQEEQQQQATASEEEANVENSSSSVTKPPEEKMKVFNRYYHLFKEGELEGLVRQIEDLEIAESAFDHENWYVFAKKKKKKKQEGQEVEQEGASVQQ